MELYTGKDAKGNETGASQLLKSSQVVARLFETLPSASDCNFKVAFDNWFSSVGLMKVLALRKIYSVCTFQLRRFRGLSFPDDRAMKKSGRGSFVQKQLNDPGSRTTAIK